MTKQLLILRHGKSDWRIDCNDFNRPLKKRGKLATKKIAMYLQELTQIPDYIISSPAKRALDTAEIICETMGLNKNQVHIDSQLYAACLKELFLVLADTPNNIERVLLVGHNPGLESLLLHLYEGNIETSEKGKLLATATLATLSMPDHWDSFPKGCAKLVSITHPAEL